jgi:hypothetical protein
MSAIYATLTGMLMLVAVSATATQQKKPAKTIVTNDNNCESNKNYFDYVAVEAGDAGSIILIARLGDRESSRVYNQRRLHNICCRNYNAKSYVPWLNDCHNLTHSCVTNAGLKDPGAPGARLGERCVKCGSPPPKKIDWDRSPKCWGGARGC